MTTSVRWSVPVLSACLILAIAGSPPGFGDSGGSVGENLVVTITVDEGGSSAKRSYRLLTRDDGSPSRLNTGWRVPIATATFAARDESGDPGTATSFSYQNIGLTTTLHTKMLDGTIEVRGNLEISAATGSGQGAPRGGAPTIGTFHQEFNVLTEPGQPLELADVSSPRGGTLSVRMRVDRLE